MEDQITLPEPALEGEVSVERAIATRRSRRSFAAEPLTLEQLAQILWAAQGITGPKGRFRAAPSAGATYPMEVFVAVGEDEVEGVQAGIYHYVPKDHSLKMHVKGDLRRRVARAALGQHFLGEAPVDILLSADYSRTSARYGERAVRYVHMEAGHIGQNIYLQAEALGLATVGVGAFHDEQIEEVFHLSANLDALYLMPLGHPKEK